MILARQYPDEARRTGRGCVYKIGCVVDGTNYSAESRSGAPYALARVLVNAGVPDQPMTVVSAGGASPSGSEARLAGEARYRSIYRMAGYTISESASKPATLARYVAYSGPSGVEGPANE